jgi:hypothetical protein
MCLSCELCKRLRKHVHDKDRTVSAAALVSFGLVVSRSAKGQGPSPGRRICFTYLRILQKKNKNRTEEDAGSRN